MKYPKEILSFNNEYVRFFIKRFPFEVFKFLVKPHLEKNRFKYIIKEITEVVSVYNVLNYVVKRQKIDKFVLYELASGDALFSHFVAHNFSNSKIFAVDLKFSEDYAMNGKSKFFDNLFFIEKDINKFDKILSDFVISIHACRELSEITIKLASKYFIIMPCCIGSKSYDEWKIKNEIAEKFFSEIENEYYKWCFYLADYAKSLGFKINFKKDNKVLSERNIIIFGRRI